MQLSAVLLARALWFVESFDLNPRGSVYYPELVKRAVEIFGFQKYPQRLEDFDEDKGVEFLAGRWGESTVEVLKIYRNGILLDTRASTAESERILQEALTWASINLGIVYSPQMIVRKAYVSNLTFRTGAPLLGRVGSSTVKLAQRINAAISTMTGDSAPWEPTSLTLHSDAFPRAPSHVPFTIQRRVETAFSEHKYFSEAPLPTDLHLKLLEQFESEVLASES